ncbi:MAG: hypothetical protein R6T96_03600, partial [Longimicrobiales bacterium]
MKGFLPLLPLYEAVTPRRSQTLEWVEATIVGMEESLKRWYARTWVWMKGSGGGSFWRGAPVTRGGAGSGKLPVSKENLMRKFQSWAVPA